MAFASLLSWFSMLIISCYGVTVKLPPLHVKCLKPFENIITPNDTIFRITCLPGKWLELSYKRSPGISPTDKFNIPPLCNWYQDGIWFYETTRWEGKVWAPGKVGTVINVKCRSSNCRMANCKYKNITITVAEQDIHFFLLSPWPIYQFQFVQFGWCAKLRNPDWKYHFSRHVGASEIVIPSNDYIVTQDNIYYSEFLSKCTGYYNYLANATYPEVGTFDASLRLQNVPNKVLTISLHVEDLLHVLSATTELPQSSNLELTWTLMLISNKLMAFQLMDENNVSQWTVSLSKYANKTNFCPPVIQNPGTAVSGILFLFNSSGLVSRRGKLGFTRGNALLSTDKNLFPVTFNMKPNQTDSYYFNQDHGLYYNATETNAHYSVHNIYWQQESLSFLFSFKSEDSSKRSLVVHILLFCEWEFDLKIYAGVRRYLVKSVNYNYGNAAADAHKLLPGTAFPFDVNKYEGFVVKVNFSKSGLKPVTLQAKFGSHVSKVLETSILVEKFPCDVLTLKINKPALNPVMTTTKGKQLTLYSTVAVKCLVPKPTIIEWKVYRIFSISDSPDWNDFLDLPQIIPRNQTTLTIPKNTLDYGLYLFRASVDIPVDDDEVDDDRYSDTLVVEVQESELIAVIAGGSFKTVGFSHSWILNGNASYDPDSPDSRDGMEFTWYCTTKEKDYDNMILSPNSKCHPDQRDLKWIDPFDAFLYVEAEELPGHRSYYFRLVVNKEDRNSHFTQEVFVESGSPPIVNMECIENCFEKFIPTERFTLSGKCTNCSTNSRPTYEWSLFQGKTEVDFDWAAKTTTGRSSAYLSILPQTFLKAVDLWYTVVLNVTTWSGAQSTNEYSFYVNSPPGAGRCFIEPSEGIALQTKFRIGCSGFKDVNQPLTYKILSSLTKSSNISSLQTNSLGVIIYNGYDSTTPPFLLPAGEPSLNYSSTLHIQVYDSLSAYTELSLNVKVYNFQSEMSQEAIVETLTSMANGSSSMINNYLTAGDYISLGHLIHMITSSLNYFKSVESTNPLQEERIQLRENLLNISSGLLSLDVMGMNQIITCIAELTEDAKEVNVQSQQLAVKKLNDLADSLGNFKKEFIGISETERLSSGIVTSLSSLMNAALLNVESPSAIVKEKVQVLEQILSTIETLTEMILQGKVPGENTTLITAASFNITLKKYDKWHLKGSALNITKEDCHNCWYPSLRVPVSDVPMNVEVSVAYYEFEESPFPWLKSGKEIDTHVTGYYMMATNDNGGVMNEMPESVEVVLNRKHIVPFFDLLFVPVEHATLMAAFTFEVDTKVKTDWFLQFFYSDDITLAVSLYVGNEVRNNTPIALFNISTMTSQVNTLKMNNFKILRLPMDLVTSAKPAVNISLQVTTRHSITSTANPNVQFSIFNAGCLFFDGNGDDWNDGNCKAGPLTDNAVVHCVCKNMVNVQTRKSRFLKHRHLFFSTRLFIPPNPINLTNVTAKSVQQNLVSLLTVIVMLILYIILNVLARKRDKREKCNRHNIVILPDNDPYDCQSLLVTFFTGSRWGSGTTGSVYLKIFGKDGSSHRHRLHCNGRKLFQTGGCDTFLLKTNCALGDIRYIEIWLKATKDSPKWYLSRVQIEDLQTKQVWYFMCRSWFKGNFVKGKFGPMDLERRLEKTDFIQISWSYDLYVDNVMLTPFAPDIPGTLTRSQTLALSGTRQKHRQRNFISST
ncbi:hypothetical protein GDO86_004215 [Hymenochirus boettgeri]|uniref:Polycystic kidney disease and receptor for egg jelly-related protein n=1 Tax=Hymenochirus boettgeri TaxID=247094 RepID=A0A8T2K9L8_9PIPI|nr:hypothetical protein GDO86_004215 [Hymenochirus boettgeri]